MRRTEGQKSMPRLNILVTRWKAVQAFLLRYPIGDFVIVWVLGLFGLAAITQSDMVIHQSHFGSLQPIVRPVGISSLLVACYLLWASFISLNKNHRRVAACCSLIMLGGLLGSVNSITGVIAWSGHTLTALFVVLAVVP